MKNKIDAKIFLLFVALFGFYLPVAANGMKEKKLPVAENETVATTTTTTIINPSAQTKTIATLQEPPYTPPTEPAELQIFRDAYPGISFDANYDKDKDDWLVDMAVGETVTQFYWAGGRFVPPENYEERERFWTLLYNYAKEIPDPANFTEEEVERIRNFSKPENRQSSGGSPQFFYDAVYDCTTQKAVERHIVRHRFFGYGVNAHERLREPLIRVEQRIRELAKTDDEVKKFVDTLGNVDGYYWRTIRDSGNRSFHSIGIAIDVLPERWGQKNLYWAWRRDIDPDNWMLLPLERRWMPPLAVIDIFEDEGFIWGGKWVIWDNMHFEYHPELVLYRKFREQQSK